MTWGLVAVAGATLVGGLISSHAASGAATTQANAASTASGDQLAMFQDIQKNLAPFLQGGQNALPILLQQLGIGVDANGKPTFDPNSPLTKPQTPFSPTTPPPSVSPAPPAFTPGQPFTPYAAFKSNQGGIIPGAGDVSQFTPYAPFKFDASTFQQSPGFQFALGQGIEAIGNKAAASGGAMGGNTLKAIADYTTGAASQDYNQQFSNMLNAYNTNYGRSLDAYDASLASYNVNYQNALQGNKLSFDEGLANQTTNFNQWLANNQNTFGQGLSTFDTNTNLNLGNQNQIFNWLSSLVSGGANAGGAIGNFGTTAANNSGSYLTSGANALAAGQIGSANAISGGINNLASMYFLKDLFSGGGSNSIFNNSALFSW